MILELAVFPSILETGRPSKRIFSHWLSSLLLMSLYVVYSPVTASHFFVSCPPISNPDFLVYHQLSPSSKLFFFCLPILFPVISLTSLTFMWIRWHSINVTNKITPFLLVRKWTKNCLSGIFSKFSILLIFYPFPKGSFFVPRQVFYFLLNLAKFPMLELFGNLIYIHN